MGRPTDNPKNFMLRARLDDKILEMLDELAEIEGKSRSEVVRESIEICYNEQLSKVKTKK